MELDEGLTFLKRMFAEYYEEALEDIPMPSSLTQREFAFIPFGEKIMIRHKGFKSPEEFKAFIRFLTPSHAYYSASYYKRPGESMDRKGWLGADLVFDIDSDHIDTPCMGEHEYWVCENCKNSITQAPQGVCSRCGSPRIRKEFWLCETCLETAKSEALKLLSFLMDDFGFQGRDMEVFFSGHRGYHVHVREERVKSLDQAARKEIVDYILGTGLRMELHGLARIRGNLGGEMAGPDLSDLGWRGRIARGAYDFLVSATLDQLEEVAGLSKAAARRLSVGREKILKVWERRAPWGNVKGVGPKTWEALAMVGVKKQASKIDPVVTTDIHRLIRISNSLHGKTGLKVVNIPLSSLEKFDPLKEAVAFHRGTLELYVYEARSFRLGDQSYGPFTWERVDLPTAAGIYLLCKKAAKLVRMSLD